MAAIFQTTLLDLVRTVNEFSTSEAETVATVAYLINSGKVRLCGNFAGAKIDLNAPVGAVASQRSFAPAVRRKTADLAVQ